MKYICDHAKCADECRSCPASESHPHIRPGMGKCYCHAARFELVRCIPVKPARKPRRAGK